MASHYPAATFLLPAESVPATPFSPHDDASDLLAAASGLGRFMVTHGSRHGHFGAFTE
jgi:hypothetical protein